MGAQSQNIEDINASTNGNAGQTTVTVVDEGGNSNTGNAANNGGESGDSGNASGDSSNNASTNGDGSTSEKVFTQEDVSRMMTKEKKQGKESVYRDLGIDPNDSEMISMIKAITSSKNTSGNGDGDSGEQKNNAANAIAEAEKRAFDAELKMEAVVAGAQNKYVDAIFALASASKATDSDKSASEIISAIKEKYPTFFEDENTSSNTGSSISSSSGHGSNKSIGQRLAASVKVNKPKKSFWND